MLTELTIGMVVKIGDNLHIMSDFDQFDMDREMKGRFMISNGDVNQVPIKVLYFYLYICIII